MQGAARQERKDLCPRAAAGQTWRPVAQAGSRACVGARQQHHGRPKTESFEHVNRVHQKIDRKREYKGNMVKLRRIDTNMNSTL
jgi:hypothetical protein